MRLLAAAFIMCLPVIAAAQIYQGQPGQPTLLGSPTVLTLNTTDSIVGVYDFNHDGNLDLLAVSFDVSTAVIFILYGDGKGNFYPGPSSFFGNGDFTWAQMADMNGDGQPDLVSCDGENQFNIAFGNADGTFEAPLTYPLTFPPVDNGLFPTFSLAVADLNGDGLPDLVIAGDAGWQALLNTGAGFVLKEQFLLQNPYYVQSPGVSLGDLNRDGKMDLVYSTQTSVRVFIGKGDGTFLSPSLAPLPSPLPSQWCVNTLADWNGDGKLDLIVSLLSPPTFYRLAGNGDGTFQPGVRMDSPYAGAQFLVADYDSDGIPDIGINAGAYFVVYPGKGGNNFGPPTSYPVVSSGPGVPILGAAIGSFRNNGRIDYAAGLKEGIGLLFNTGSSFETAPEIPASGASVIRSVDLNRDGHTDLITLGSTGFQVYWGTGKLAKPFLTGPVSPPPVWYTSSFALGDFNGDGLTDIVVPQFEGAFGDQIAVYAGDGKGHFGSAVFTSVECDTGNVVTGDLNGDGKADLVLSCNGHLAAMLGNGNGTFQAPVVLENLTPIVGYAPIRLADLNGDGKLDIFTALNVAFNAPGIIVLLNRGDGTFSPPAVYQGAAVTDLVACDTNGDGVPDIVGAMGVGYPQVLLGKSDGTFTPLSVPDSDNFEGSALACGTFTASSPFGQIAMTSNYDFGVEILKGSPTGALRLSPVAWGTDVGPLDVISGKFHGNNQLDDLVVLNGNGTISVLFNLTKP